MGFFTKNSIIFAFWDKPPECSPGQCWREILKKVVLLARYMLLVKQGRSSICSVSVNPVGDLEIEGESHENHDGYEQLRNRAGYC